MLTVAVQRFGVVLTVVLGGQNDRRVFIIVDYHIEGTGSSISAGIGNQECVYGRSYRERRSGCETGDLSRNCTGTIIRSNRSKIIYNCSATTYITVLINIAGTIDQGIFSILDSHNERTEDRSVAM